METWKKILLGTGIGLLGCYLIFSLVFFKGRRDGRECRQFVIEMSDAKSRRFVGEQELRSFLSAESVSPEKQVVTIDGCRRIEEAALRHQMVRKAACYQLANGDVKLSIEQRQPRLRVMGGYNYFVDSDRRIMPVRSTTASDVMVVTGQVSEKMAKGPLFDFVDWLSHDDFWNAQIEQINVVSPKRIELVPRIGTGIILLGSLDHYQSKLAKLKRLYKDGFAKFGWKDYREIDLRFRGQIVCR